MTILSPSPIQKFFDNNGQPLANGLLFTYKAGTSTKQATFVDSTGSTPNTNPIVLNYRGECNLWIDPTLAYKFVLAPSTDTDPPSNPFWSVDNISAFGIGLNFDLTAVDTGSVNAIAVSIPTLSSPVAFSRIVVKVANTNTGATTITVNGGTAKAVTWQSTVPLSGGEMVANGIYEFIFDGAQWQLQGPTLAPGDVRLFGAKGDGVTDNAAAILAAIAAMPASGGSLSFAPGAVYAVSAPAGGLLLSGKSNFKIFGNGATIKVLSGTGVVGGNGMLYFASCTDGYIENLTLDANRAGRTPNGAGAYSIQVSTSCARLFFKNVSCPNSVIDGFTLVTTNGGSQATYPTDITFEDCSADNAYRNGMSIIGSVRCKVTGGSYTNTTGTSPQYGIDVEPDVTYTFGNTDLTIDGVNVTGNAGYGIGLGGGAAQPNTRVVLRNIRGNSNSQGLLNLAQATGCYVDGVQAGPHSALTRGVIDVGTAITDVTIRNVKMNNISASGAGNYGIYVHSSSTPPIVIENVEIVDIACQSFSSSQIVRVDGLTVTRCAFDAAFNVDTAAGSVFRNVTFDTPSARCFLINAADVELDGITVLNCGAVDRVIQFTASATGGILTNVNNRQSTSIPVGQIVVLWQAVPRIMRDVFAKSAGTDYTAANIATFSAGTSGAYISDCQPDPFRNTFTWDPPSIANGSQASTTVTITGARLGDPAFAAPGIDIGTLNYSAQVVSNDTVRVVLYNNTGGAVDIASSTWTAWVEKR